MFPCCLGLVLGTGPLPSRFKLALSSLFSLRQALLPGVGKQARPVYQSRLPCPSVNVAA